DTRLRRRKRGARGSPRPWQPASAPSAPPSSPGIPARVREFVISVSRALRVGSTGNVVRRERPVLPMIHRLRPIALLLSSLVLAGTASAQLTDITQTPN